MAEFLSGSPLDISASALSAQRRRMGVIASNIANANSLQTADGGPYRRRTITFETVMNDTMNEEGAADGLGGVKIASIKASNEPFKSVYDPQHPLANKEGFVQTPNINVTQEMVEMVSAQREYEANLAAMKAYREILRSSMSILKR